MQQKSTMIASVRFLTLAREGIFGTLDVMIERTLFLWHVPRALQLGGQQGRHRSRGQEGPADRDQNKAGSSGQTAR